MWIFREKAWSNLNLIDYTFVEHALKFKAIFLEVRLGFWTTKSTLHLYQNLQYRIRNANLFDINVTSVTDKAMCCSINDIVVIYYRHFANTGMHCVIVSNTIHIPKAPVTVFNFLASILISQYSVR